MRIEQLGDLDVFVHIVELGSLAKAARTLEVTKNVVTRRLARLESQLGKPLLLRTTRGATLTEDGRQFYQHCLRILSEVVLAEDAIVDHDTLHGTLRLGIPTLLLAEASLVRIHNFMSANPNLDLQIVASDQPFNLVTQRLDVAVAVGPQPDSSLLRRSVSSKSNAVLAASTTYIERRGRPKALHDLKHHDCLKFQTDAPQRSWTLIDAHGTEHQVPVGGSFSSDNSSVLKSAMHAGLGIGITSRSSLRKQVTASVLVSILPRCHLPPFPISLVYQRQAARGNRLEPLLDMLGEVVAANFA